MALKRTPLYKHCLNDGGRMVPFAGWEMPVQFSGLIKEHHAVRNNAGLFDISHMGVLLLEGNNPKDILQSLVPSDLHRIGPGEACYTVLLNENGCIIDDLIVYDLGQTNKNIENLLLIINAGCTARDIAWLKQNLEPANITVSDAKSGKALMALQGPKSMQILETITTTSLQNLPRFGHRKLAINKMEDEGSESIFISRTGYTGEDGFEILAQSQTATSIWTKLIKAGVSPCGLGARDTLRLEAGMHLYGNDMNSQTTPFEAGLGWLVHLEMPTNFIGRDALEQQTEQGLKRRLVGLTIQGRGIARNGYQVLHKGLKVGEVTSGTWSPTLRKAIALAYIPTELSKINSSVEIDIRGTQYAATVVKLPFYRKA